MSIRLEINAADTFELHSEMKNILRGDQNMHFVGAPQQIGMRPELGAPYGSSREVDKPANADLVAGPEITASDVAQRSIDAGASPEFAAAQVQPPQKKRGPKPKDKSESAPPPSEPTAVTAAPPSDGAGQPAAETQPGTPSPAVSADILSFDEFKKKLNEMQSSGPNALGHITAALAAFGYQKVKDVKPEHYADVVGKAEALIAGDK